MNIQEFTNVPDPTNVQVSESPVPTSGPNQFLTAFEIGNCTSLPAAEEHAPPLPEQRAVQSNGTMDTPRQRPQKQETAFQENDAHTQEYKAKLS